ncbi:MAG: hypothetical protein IJN43_08400 [Ruminococcus sp.]|nr:hypothetical protein [Ruminococcus sp.]
MSPGTTDVIVGTAIAIDLLLFLIAFTASIIFFVLFKYTPKEKEKQRKILRIFLIISLCLFGITALIFGSFVIWSNPQNPK